MQASSPLLSGAVIWPAKPNLARLGCRANQMALHPAALCFSRARATVPYALPYSYGVIEYGGTASRPRTTTSSPLLSFPLSLFLSSRLTQPNSPSAIAHAPSLSFHFTLIVDVLLVALLLSTFRPSHTHSFSRTQITNFVYIPCEG